MLNDTSDMMIHQRLAPRDGFQRRAAAAALRRVARRLRSLGAQRRGPGEGLSEAPQIPGGRPAVPGRASLARPKSLEISGEIPKSHRNPWENARVGGKSHRNF